MESTKSNPIILFPHLPKTGGSSIQNNFHHHWTQGEEFYHLGPGGMKVLVDYPQYDMCRNTKKHKVIFGHAVDESLYRRYPNRIIELHTTLRHPLKRMISHYNHSQKDTINPITLDRYMYVKRNASCAWYVAKFPSLVKNVFDPLVIQATTVLDHFDQIYYTEQLNEQIEKLFERYNISFDPQRNINIGGVHYDKVSLNQTLQSDSCLSHVHDDMILYRHFLAHKPKMTPFEPKSRIYHSWFMPVLNNLFFNHMDRSTLIRTLKGSVLAKILKDSRDSKTLDALGVMHILIDTYHEYKTYAYHEENCVEVMDWLLSFEIDWPQRSIDQTNPLSVLYRGIATHKYTKLSDIISEVWFDMSDKSIIVLNGRITTMMESHRAKDDLYNTLLHAVKLRPHQANGFRRLARCIEDYELDDRHYISAIEKVMELNPKSKWAKKRLMKVFNK